MESPSFTLILLLLYSDSTVLLRHLYVFGIELMTLDYLILGVGIMYYVWLILITYFTIYNNLNMLYLVLLIE